MKLSGSEAPTVGNVKSFVRDRVFPADGERLEIKALMQDYRTWCAQRGVPAVELYRFLNEIEGECRKGRHRYRGRGRQAGLLH